jgi:hypothetical protein
LRVASFALAANPSGSKSPTGDKAPGIVSTVKAGFAAVFAAPFAFPKEPKASAEAANRARETAMNFIVSGQLYEDGQQIL